MPTPAKPRRQRPTLTRTNVRLPLVVVDHIISSDWHQSRTGHSAGFSSVTRAAVSGFIAAGHRSIPSRVLNRRLGTKLSDRTFTLSLPQAELRHWKRIARAHGHSGFLPLVASAWAAVYGLFPVSVQ
jgi:hypothetical protein